MIEVRYKSRIGKFSRKQENMEEAENKIKYSPIHLALG